METLEKWMKKPGESVECRHCKRKNIVKHGHRMNRSDPLQVYLCKDCKRTFTDRTTFAGMKHKGTVITATLDLYFKNVSLRKIQDHLKQFYGVNVSHVTILNWVRKYSKIIKKANDGLMAEGCGIIHADEMMVKVGGKWMWFWDVMDRDSRFVLSSSLTKGREGRDAMRVFADAKKKLRDKPRLVITDGLASYRIGHRWVFGNRTGKSEHWSLINFKDKRNNNVMERLMGTNRERVKIMRGFKKPSSADAILGGWTAYYNLLRPHTGLNGLTPAQKLGIEMGLNGGNRWEELIKSCIMRQFQ